MYKAHYDDVVELYSKASFEASKYPWFKFSIHCIKYDMDGRANVKGGR
jgi:hypothetical protein